MSNDTRTAETAPTWGTLEPFACDQAQQFIQRILEEEITELLGRARSERRATVDAPLGYRNGHGKPRRLAIIALWDNCAARTAGAKASARRGRA